MTDIKIKKWTVDDWQTFKSIRLEAVSKHDDVFGSAYKTELNKNDTYWKDTLSEVYKGAVFGLYDGDTNIGLTAVFRHRDHSADTVIFAMSYIRDGYRGINLSDLLYKARIDWAKVQSGITRIWVGHREGNEASRRANQRHGFVLLSTEDMTFGNGETDKHYTYELKIQSKT